MEGRNVSIVHQSAPQAQSAENSVVSNHQSLTENTCWVVIPRIRKQITLSQVHVTYFRQIGYIELPIIWTDYEVQQTYMTLKNVANIPGSNISITDFFTG